MVERPAGGALEPLIQKSGDCELETFVNHALCRIPK
jgi:hypothetical protein